MGFSIFGRGSEHICHQHFEAELHDTWMLDLKQILHGCFGKLRNILSSMIFGSLCFQVLFDFIFFKSSSQKCAFRLVQQLCNLAKPFSLIFAFVLS